MKVHNFSAFVGENFNFGILMSSDPLWEDAHSLHFAMVWLASYGRRQLRKILICILVGCPGMLHFEDGSGISVSA